MNHHFAGFLMTYERTAILEKTIQQIFNQTLPPSKLLIVDNSVTEDTQRMIEQLNDSRLEYLRVGYNSGPAGAAKIGLEKLTQEGFEWIYWGDDDDPPTFENSFEKLFEMIHANLDKNIGIVGGVGQYFNRWTGIINRVSDGELLKRKAIPVDSIAGGQTMIVNSNVVKKGILPVAELYFGFEELDFCLKVKRAGFDLLVPTELFLRAREKYDRLNFKRSSYLVKDKSQLVRQYYSTRNLLVILKNHRFLSAYLFQFFKSIFKAIYGFRFGWDYGMTSFRFIGKGQLHGMMNRMGKYQK